MFRYITRCSVMTAEHRPESAGRKDGRRSLRLRFTIWVTPENQLTKFAPSRLFCFNAGFSGVPRWSDRHQPRAISDPVHKPAYSVCFGPNSRHLTKPGPHRPDFRSGPG